VAWPPGRVIHMTGGTASMTDGTALTLPSGGVCASLEEAQDA